MRPGALNKMVLLQRQSGSDWATYATVPARVAPVAGSRTPGELDPQKVWIAYRPDVRRDHRVLHGSRELWIDDVSNPAERSVELVLYCSERPASDYNRTITLQASAPVSDTEGGYTDAWADVATLAAKVEPLEGDEQIQAMQAGMTRPHRFTIPYRTDVSGTTRVLYDGRQFDVRSVIDPGARHWEIVIMADEVRS